MTQHTSSWRALFDAVASGKLSPADAAEQAAASEMVSIPGATVDLGRQQRCGFAEVIYGEGKSAELITAIATKLLQREKEVLVTRCAAEAAEQLRGKFSGFRYHSDARTVRLSLSTIPDDPPDAVGKVAVVGAGSTDRPVVYEAVETLRWMRLDVTIHEDLGVAGPQRLLAAVPSLRMADVVVVVAGMEGALPSVVAGHVAAPVIAVPTSVGYGASMQGLTAMLGMLVSCAANVAVVNIDAGFKGGYLAGLIAKRIAEAQTRSPTL